MTDNSTLFVLSWDQLGLEAVVNVTDIEKEILWNTLQDKKGTNKIGQTVTQLMLRARYNPQRHYEIYSITVAEGITEEDIRTMFENDPQGSAELVRERGKKIFSDRARTNQIKIT